MGSQAFTEENSFATYYLLQKFFLGISSGFDNIKCKAAGAAGDPGPVNTIPTNGQVISTGVHINIFNSEVKERRF